MTPQRKRAVERVAQVQRRAPHELELWLRASNHESVELVALAVDEAERAIVAEGLLRDLDAELDKYAACISSPQSFEVMDVLADIVRFKRRVRSFLSAEGERDGQTSS